MSGKHLLGLKLWRLKTGSAKSNLPQAHGVAGERLQASTNHWWSIGAGCWLLGGLHDLTWWCPLLAAWGCWPKTEMSTVPSCPFALSKLPNFSYMNYSSVTVFRKHCFYIVCSVLKNRGICAPELLVVHLFSRACVCSRKSHSIPMVFFFIF